MGAALERIEAALHGRIRRHGNQYAARCPVPSHGDGDRPENWSLRIDENETRVILYCHGGCRTEDVAAALGLSMPDLYNKRLGKDLARYVYTDMMGNARRTVHRRDGKQFRQSFVDDAARHDAPPLYRLPRVVEAIANDQPIYLVEGEEDVHTLEAHGLVATTGPQGAGNFGKVDVTPLRGAAVLAIRDKDAPGVKWAALVKERLTPLVASLTILQAAAGKDVSDHLTAGHSLDELELVEAVEILAENQAEQASDTPQEARKLVLTPASSIGLRVPRWLYTKRIPTHGITLLAGREGIGKSTIAFDLCAKVTRGELDGEFHGTPRNVAIVAGEDSWASVICPRLVAVGVDLDRVYRVDVLDEGHVGSVTLPVDVERLRQACADYEIAMVVMDPIISVISGKLDSHKDREVRVALDPLSRFAADADVAILGLIHVNKSGASDLGDSIMGSRAFTAVARSVLFCMRDADEPRGDRFWFGQSKSNLGPEQSTFGYHLIDFTFPSPNEEDEGRMFETSRVVFDEEDPRTIRQIVMESKEVESVENDGRKARAERGRQQLLDWIREQHLAVSVGEIQRALPDISRASLFRYLKALVAEGLIIRVGELYKDAAP
jgi:hypothetical protein